MMVDLQVAETPWTTKVEGLGTLGYQTMSIVSIISPLTVLFGYEALIAPGCLHGVGWPAAVPAHPDTAIVR